MSKRLSFIKLLPNIFTTIGLCTGLTAIRFALDSDWEKAVICVLVAAFFDLVDGLSARLLKAFSRFGAELDSLADAISFGVAPSMVLFLWVRGALSYATDPYFLGWYWIPFLLYTMCCAFRLARFNVTIHQNGEQTKILKNYFVGVPSPAGAGLILLPIVLENILKRFHLEYSVLNYSNYLLLWVILISFLMISKIPTFSLRNLRLNISSTLALPILLFVCLVVAVFIKEMWISLCCFGLFYLLTIPFSVLSYKKNVLNKS